MDDNKIKLTKKKCPFKKEICMRVDRFFFFFKVKYISTLFMGHIEFMYEINTLYIYLSLIQHKIWIPIFQKSIHICK